MATFTLNSTGGASTGATSIMINGMVIAPPSDYTRGINLAVVDQATFTLIEFRNFPDDMSSAEQTKFAQFLEMLPIGRLVFIVVNGDASSLITSRCKTACRALGSADVCNLQANMSWAFVGKKGAAPGTRPEQSAMTAVELTGELNAQPIGDGGYMIRVTSAGFLVGDTASITINGELVLMAGGYRRGLNLAVIDSTSLAVLSTEVFDTYASPKASERFAQTIAALPQGHLAVVAVMDDAAASLTPNARNAIASLGGVQGAGLGYRNSYALIGFKGVVASGACESLSGVSPACSCCWYQPQISTDYYFSIGAQSAGFSCGDIAALSVNDMKIVAPQTATRGYNVTVVSPENGVVLSMASFDVYGGINNADAMAVYIDAMPIGCIVLVAVKDEGFTNLNDNARRALRSIGAAQIGNLQYRNSYLLLGRKGAAPGSVPEMLMADSIISSCFRYPMSDAYSAAFQVVAAMSSGFTAGDESHIELNGVTVPIDGRNCQRGMNVVVFDRMGNILASKNFDTYLTYDASEEFASLINGLPNGDLVAIVVRDEATWHLTPAARQACKTIGSAYIDQLQYRESWAIVGTKGAAVGTAAETRPSSNIATCQSWVSPTPPTKHWVTLGARSAGFLVGDYAEITVNDVPVTFPAGRPQRGLNVAVIDPVSGVVLSSNSFDTHLAGPSATAFVEYIGSVEVGKYVAIAVQDDAFAGLTPNAIRACEMIGSTMINGLGSRSSWALVGMKGGAPGSALENVNGFGPTAVRGTFGLIPEKKHALIFGIDDLLVAVLALAVLVVVALVFQISKVSDRRPRPIQRSAKRRALLVGIEYFGFKEPTLIGPSAYKMMNDLYTSVCNGGLFKSKDVRFLTEVNRIKDPLMTPSKTNVLRELNSLLSGARAGDVLYFHFFGHGSPTSLPGQERLLTLNSALNWFEVILQNELERLFANLNPKVNLTCVFHCCYSGSMIDASSNGRGIAYGSSSDDEKTASNLKGANLTSIVGTQMIKSNTNSYATVLNICMEQKIQQTVQLIANPQLYDLKQLIFLRPLP